MAYVHTILIFMSILGQHKPASHPSAPEAVSAVLPAYCDPPNPCPLGYGAEDGCIEGWLSEQLISVNRLSMYFIKH